MKKNVKRSSSKKRLVSTTNNSLDLSMTIDKVSIWQKKITFFKTADRKVKVFLISESATQRCNIKYLFLHFRNIKGGNL